MVEKIHYLLVDLNQALLRMEMELERLKRDNRIMKGLLNVEQAGREQHEKG